MSVVVITENFVELAEHIARSREVPEIPKIVLTKDVEKLKAEDLEKLAEKTLDEIVRMITQ
jgi:hypothetical protein